MTIDQTHVIVGASLAGAKAAETLRQEGFDGRVVLVGAEDERPYERPPLSKDYLRGEVGREKVYVHDEAFYAKHEIELALGRSAVSLDTGRQELALDDGQRLRYDRLLLATGAEPRRLSIPGAELDGVLYLRSVLDSDGVRMLMGTGVEAFEGSQAVERVRTSDGRELDCDFVVVGVGVEPRTELARQGGLAVDNGILVDEQLQSSAPGVFAAGDVASAHHPFYGERIRVEHWANALNQGPAAARSLLGGSTAYERLPYFFSDQYDVGMEYTGFARAWDRVVFRGEPAAREFVAFWMVEDRVVAGMNVNVWDVGDPIKRLIGERAAVDDRRLADPGIPLDAVASPARGGVA